MLRTVGAKGQVGRSHINLIFSPVMVRPFHMHEVSCRNDEKCTFEDKTEKMAVRRLKFIFMIPRCCFKMNSGIYLPIYQWHDITSSKRFIASNDFQPYWR